MESVFSLLKNLLPSFLVVMTSPRQHASFIPLQKREDEAQEEAPGTESSSYYLDVKCPGCCGITTIFSHAQMVVACVGAPRSSVSQQEERQGFQRMLPQKEAEPKHLSGGEWGTIPINAPWIQNKSTAYVRSSHFITIHANQMKMVLH